MSNAVLFYLRNYLSFYLSTSFIALLELQFLPTITVLGKLENDHNSRNIPPYRFELYAQL